VKRTWARRAGKATRTNFALGLLKVGGFLVSAIAGGLLATAVADGLVGADYAIVGGTGLLDAYERFAHAFDHLRALYIVVAAVAVFLLLITTRGRS
jgi:hypothetical protein